MFAFHGVGISVRGGWPGRTGSGNGPRTEPKPAIRCRRRGRPGFQTVGQSASALGGYTYGYLFTHRNHGRTLSKPPSQRQRLFSTERSRVFEALRPLRTMP